RRQKLGPACLLLFHGPASLDVQERVADRREPLEGAKSRSASSVSASARRRCRALRYLRMLRISTTSLVWEPRASAICWPSFDQAKLKIWPAVKSVTCFGGPPSRSCAQMLETPCWSRM